MLRIGRRRKNKHNNDNNNNNNNDSNNGGLIFKPVSLAAIALSIIPILLIVAAPLPAIGQQQQEEEDDDDQEEEQQDPEPEAEPEPESSSPTTNALVSTTDNPNTITTATPETGIVTTPLANQQQLQESLTGTPMGPEVTNPGLNPRATLPLSIPMQDYRDFKAALAQNGYNFNDNDVLYTQAYGDGRTIMLIMGTEANTAQPPAMLLDQLAVNWGFQMLTYAYNADGQLVTVFLEAF